MTVLKSMSQENVRYAGSAVCPALSENENLSCGQVIEAVIRGMNRGKNEFDDGLWHLLPVPCAITAMRRISV